MKRIINPFHELYVTESIGPELFVKLFSSEIVNPVLPLFQPGNIILKGLPGTGKTMLLNLLNPSIRIAYKKCNKNFPIPNNFSNFIGAGINLILSSVSDFGQRPINNNSKDLHELAIYFGDFINYWIVKDILDSIVLLEQDLGKELGINLSKSKLDKFISEIKKDDIWFGYLSNVNTFDELKIRLKKRIVDYRSYLNYNIDTLPQDITSSKTRIGEPISLTANLLRECGIISEKCQVYIRIDQYEDLVWLDKSIDGLGKIYQSIIHKLLAKRDTSVSYKIGTRPFAWSDDKQVIFGTSARLESLRNYKSISIDDVLRRPEHSSTYIFPSFAQDIFKKRLKESQYIIGSGDKDLLKEVFGLGLDPKEKALKYVTTARENIVNLDDDWPDKWKNFLKNLANIDPLSARLGEAWARQKDKNDIIYNVPDKVVPWEQKQKQYWRKERIEQALLQIASRNRQQLIWEGKEDIISLSGGNILAFLSICQQIWEVWIRSIKAAESFDNVPKMTPEIQTLGILEASVRWYENISNEQGGQERKLFISYLGSKLYRRLIDDLKMSYPGRNGFSLELKDIEENPLIDSFLKDAADYGDLHERPHTTRYKRGEKRIKWYLNPILSPVFKLPASHTKEPLYLTIYEFKTWMLESRAFANTELGTELLNVKEVPVYKKPKRNKKSDPNQTTFNF